MRRLETLSALLRAVDTRIGWSRIGMAASAAVVAGALFILYQMLQHIDVGRVIAAIRATPPQTIQLAGLFVAAGYVTLTFYDYFALRTNGRREVPYRVAAFASFTSYTIGHNLGAAVFTGGAVRLRIYSAWGLGIVDVAKIAFITGLTFWLGNVFVLGLALSWAPDTATAVTHVPAGVTRALGLAALLAIACYVVWLLRKPRCIGRAGWQIALPNARLTLVQIGIGVLDFAAGVLAFYMLMPTTPAPQFAVVAVAFVAATLLGFITHAPGSLGFFDATMLLALTQFEKEELLAALLIFRFLYFVVPFAVAVLALAIRELVLAWAERPCPEAVARDAPSR
jgi:uncharacterized membrane protein YbhN (UPF0104 family)